MKIQCIKPEILVRMYISIFPKLNFLLFINSTDIFNLQCTCTCSIVVWSVQTWKQYMVHCHLNEESQESPCFLWMLYNILTHIHSYPFCCTVSADRDQTVVSSTCYWEARTEAEVGGDSEIPCQGVSIDIHVYAVTNIECSLAQWSALSFKMIAT